MHAGLQAVAEVEAPGSHDFLAESERGTLKRLLALDCVQDPGNLVRSCSWHFLTMIWTCALAQIAFRSVLARCSGSLKSFSHALTAMGISDLMDSAVAETMTRVLCRYHTTMM